jgi:hypothetical protein
MSWLVHSLNTFGVKTNRGQTRTHKTHHIPEHGGNHHIPPYSIICAFPQGPHPNGILSRDSQMGVLKFPKSGLPQLWVPIILCVDLQLQ